LQIVKAPYLNKKIHPILKKFGTQNSVSHMTKYENFIIQHGGRPPFKQIIFGHNSAADCPISVNFTHGSKTAWR